ncbi:class I SAM-dependent methyltransferase [Paracraurococcus lichenis]|uniref:Class I SAM-dependent methyltransferase n=1 Tax=Paracraurococcus lichenis TaxID=3064888 RepID=A0ABT9E788_9PROT|nr:class I SAM-dependent methyltransferase [Paracraurococcus sp. LOR1-02]MDO9711957.1 class I SAM-dependent methyltransferase [Paracraurococcus sp. LOR1-02]
MTEPDWRATNHALWEERTAVHLAPGGYDLAALRAGAGRLDAIVEAELGPVAGLRVLHLQCHFGRDTLTLAQRGAAATGLDFSGAAIAAARGLAAELGLADRARFVEADLYAAPAAIPEPAGFDLVFVTWGALPWLPDIAGWARIVAGFLRPGGRLYLAEAHPAALVFDDAGEGATPGRPGWLVPYFEREAVVLEATEDYANPEARLTSTRETTWMHPLSAVVGALRGAGLALDWLHEHPRVSWRMFRGLARDADGLWAWPGKPWLPLAYSLSAVKEHR